MKGRFQAEGWLVVCTLIWGGTFSFSKSALDSASPLLVVAMRFAVAALVLMIVAFREIRRMDRSVLRAGLILGSLMFVGFATQTAGLKYTTASRSAFITQLLMIFTPLFQWWIEKKKPRAANLAGAVVVIIGMYYLTSPEAGGFNEGDALTLICAVENGLYIVLIDVYAKRLPVVQIVFLQIVVAGVLSGIGSLFEGPYLTPTLPLLGFILYLGIPASVVAVYLQNRYQKESTPVRASIIYSLEPVFAALFAMMFLGESLGAAGLFGAGLILGGILVSELTDPILVWTRSRRRSSPG